jgi:hypothetical protein
MRADAAGWRATWPATTPEPFSKHRTHQTCRRARRPARGTPAASRARRVHEHRGWLRRQRRSRRTIRIPSLRRPLTNAAASRSPVSATACCSYAAALPKPRSRAVATQTTSNIPASIARALYDTLESTAADTAVSTTSLPRLPNACILAIRPSAASGWARYRARRGILALARYVAGADRPHDDAAAGGAHDAHRRAALRVLRAPAWRCWRVAPLGWSGALGIVDGIDGDALLPAPYDAQSSLSRVCRAGARGSRRNVHGATSPKR